MVLKSQATNAHCKSLHQDEFRRHNIPLNSQLFVLAVISRETKICYYDEELPKWTVGRLSADRLRADYRQATHRLRQATDRFLKRKVCCRIISQQSADRRPGYGRNGFSGAVLLNYPISCNRQESPLTSFSGVKTTTNSPNLHNKTKR